MREVVDDCDAALHAAHFHPALDALKGLQSALNLLRRQASHAGDGDVGERVDYVVLTRKRGVEAGPLLPFPPRGERASLWRELGLGNEDVAAARGAEGEPAHARVH